MITRRNFSAKFFLGAALLSTKPVLAFSSSENPADIAIRALADQTAKQIANGEFAAVYSSCSPTFKSSPSLEDMEKSSLSLQNEFGQIKSYVFEGMTFEKQLASSASQWQRMAAYWYSVKTEKYPSGALLAVKVTKEQNNYYVAGYSLLRSLSGKKPTFLQK